MDHRHTLTLGMKPILCFAVKLFLELGPMSRPLEQEL